MQIIAVDTDKCSLSVLMAVLKKVYPGSEIKPFSDPMSAVKYAFNNRVDTVYTEIPMRGVDGFTLVKLIRQHNERMEVYFVTSKEIYANEALLIQADGYLLKPITVEAIRKPKKIW